MKNFVVQTFLMLLAWIGLSGLADGIVEWREWYEFGVMEHWRIVKAWITDTLLFWVPFNIPDWLVDSTLVGTVLLRSIVSTITSYADIRKSISSSKISESEPQKQRVGNLLENISILLLTIIMIPICILSWGLFWPFMLTLLIINVALEALNVEPPLLLRKDVLLGAGDPKAALLAFFTTVALFIPFLFIVTNELPELTRIW
ncbi:MULTISPECIES: hypothetical protein [unclassified Roseovarius]|uniref:hypothetical protein n=1 Tax=unclassified Roseovarius TaxID=2614913 RepID=UPI00273FFCE7|nr:MULTISPECIES: hypothetical protein [unclassified Roseovarius]